MGSVIDFLSLVLRGAKPSRARHHRATVPSAIFDEDAFRDALAKLDATGPAEVIALGSGFAAACLSYGADRRQVASIGMQAFPEAAWILIFDGDGYVREAALHRLNSPPLSEGRFVAIAIRLNDWVPQVRVEAAATARRLWSKTAPDIVAAAAPYLLRQRFNWGRWNNEAIIVDEVIGRADVAEAFNSMLLKHQGGALGRTLSQALRFTAYEAGLSQLALEAALPDVRAIAMKTLLNRKAVWPTGYGWAWIDKSMGERRRVTLTDSRTVSVTAPPDLLERGLVDRSALVRKAAADVVIERMNDLPEIAAIASLLADDRSAAVRDRADYIRRHLKGTEAEDV